ncbi:hypothetical protein AVDCRST_MAG84-2093 [uncultured Microcoleus sp.]|uniref:Uncharacterized protein n=1 Tax=uncultured Microcoleus sp. TaxID=259945 RepID=A0A6J4LN43_9CYAN|nr:hypothetical protein AVDCRST_MAG84-2093 [uncultured Microcoleus sp.]
MYTHPPSKKPGFFPNLCTVTKSVAKTRFLATRGSKTKLNSSMNGI